MRRGTPALLALFVVATCILAAGGPRGRLAYLETYAPTTFNPLYPRTMTDVRAQELVFDRLFFRSAVTNEVRSRLVDKVEQPSPDEVRLTLATGVTWHDGAPFSAGDICFTVAALRSPDTPDRVGWGKAVASCRIDSGQAVIRFRRAVDDPRLHLGFHVLPAHVFDGVAAIPESHPFARSPIGTGAMQVVPEGDSWRFVAHPGSPARPPVKTLDLRVERDPATAVRALLKGDVDGIIDVPPAYIPELKASDRVQLREYPMRAWWFVALNTKKAPLDNLRVRRALDLSLDRAKLCALTVGKPAAGEKPRCNLISGPFVPSSPYYNDGVPVVQFDPKGVLREMMAAGAAKDPIDERWHVDGEPISLKIGIQRSVSPDAMHLLVLLANQLEAAGFHTQLYELSAEEWSSRALDGQLTEYDLLVGRWVMGHTDNIGAIFHSRRDGRGSMNLFDYSNREIDALLQAHEHALTDTDALNAYWEAHAVLADDRPYLFLWTVDAWSAWNRKVDHAVITPYFYFTDFDGWTLR